MIIYDMMIKIQVKLRSGVVIESKSIRLDPCATTTLRRFVFNGVQWITKGEDYRFENEFTVCIYYFKKNSESEYYTEFNLFVRDFSGFHENEWRVSGLLRNDEYDHEYRQGMTDVFELWQEEKDIDWFALPVNGHLKKDYFLSCLFYSGISDVILKRDIYEIDMTKVKEEGDFLYLAGLAFLGYRGYIGYDLYTFDDCLLTISHNEGHYFTDVKVIFTGTKNLSTDVMSFYMEIIDILKKFRFEVIEK